MLLSVRPLNTLAELASSSNLTVGYVPFSAYERGLGDRAGQHRRSQSDQRDQHAARLDHPGPEKLDVPTAELGECRLVDPRASLYWVYIPSSRVPAFAPLASTHPGMSVTRRAGGPEEPSASGRGGGQRVPSARDL